MNRFIDLWKQFWIGVWRIIKQIGSVRGVIALILTWLALSGVGVGFVGIILNNAYLVGLGGTIVAFWVAPFTPLIPICIAIAMLFQRYVLRDKSVGWKQIKAQFKEAFAKDENVRKRRYRYRDIAIKTNKRGE